MSEYQNIVEEDGYIAIEYVEVTDKRRCHYCRKFIDRGQVMAITHEGGWEDHPTCMVLRRRRDRYAQWNVTNPIINGHHN